MFRLQNGEFGICAVKPVIVDGMCYGNREKLALKSNSKVVLVEEDMSVIAEYEAQINVNCD